MNIEQPVTSIIMKSTYTHTKQQQQIGKDSKNTTKQNQKRKENKKEEANRPTITATNGYYCRNEFENVCVWLMILRNVCLLFRIPLAKTNNIVIDEKIKLTSILHCDVYELSIYFHFLGFFFV